MTAPRSLFRSHQTASPLADSAGDERTGGAHVALVIDDHAIVAQIRGGDRAAFERVFLAYYDQLVYFAQRYGTQRADAEELVQTVFAGIWEGRARLTVRETFRAYLFGAVRNRRLNAARATRVRDTFLRHVLDVSDPAERVRDPHPADADAESHETAVAVRRAIAALPERGREAVTLHLWHGLSYAEAGAVMGVSEKTVQAHVTRALRRMRDNPALRAHSSM